jgi:hypothetical protein
MMESIILGCLVDDYAWTCTCLNNLFGPDLPETHAHGAYWHAVEMADRKEQAGELICIDDMLNAWSTGARRPLPPSSNRSSSH